MNGCGDHRLQVRKHTAARVADVATPACDFEPAQYLAAVRSEDHHRPPVTSAGLENHPEPVAPSFITALLTTGPSLYQSLLSSACL